MHDYNINSRVHVCCCDTPLGLLSVATPHAKGVYVAPFDDTTQVHGIYVKHLRYRVWAVYWSTPLNFYCKECTSTVRNAEVLIVW